MCKPQLIAGMSAASQAAQSYGAYRSSKAAQEAGITYAEQGAANARKAYLQTLSDLTKRGLQEASIISANTAAELRKRDKRIHMESLSAGENLVNASLHDNIRYRLQAAEQGRRAQRASATNIASMARGANVQYQSRVNQLYSQIPVASGFGISDILGIASAGVRGYSLGKDLFD